MQKFDDLLECFYKAKEFVVQKGFAWEIRIVQERTVGRVTAEEFLSQYIWVVVSAGMKNQVAEKIHQRIMQSGNANFFNHKSKREAIALAFQQYESWFENFLDASDKISYLASLRWIGNITKFHLARNLGMDVVKPDRHMTRLAEKFGFKDPHAMCLKIQEATHERLGVIDVILWRASNLGLLRTASQQKT